MTKRQPGHTPSRHRFTREQSSKGGKATQAQRAVARLGEVQATLDKLEPLGNLDFMDRFSMTGETWAVQRMVAKVLDGLPLTDAEGALYREVSGRTTIPKNVRTLWEIFGRRGGKSHFASVVAVHAATRRYPKLAKGEKGRVLLLAQNREQADVLFGYVHGAFTNDAELSQLVVSQTRDTLTLAHGIVVQVATSNFRAVRGFTTVCVVADESAFWWSDDDAANPDREVLRALRPSLATTRGRMICVTTPFARRGAAYDAYQRYYGKDDADSTLVLNAPSIRVNPTLDAAEIQHDEEEDPEHAAAEWHGQWRADKEGYVRLEVLDAVTAVGVTERPPQTGIRYKAAVDVAGGSGKDSYTLSIGHIEEVSGGDRWVQDLLREWKPPFSPGMVTAEVAGICSVYGVHAVVGDRYGGGFPPEEFSRHGMKYLRAERDASAYYTDALALLNTRRVLLLDDQRMRRQFSALRREHSGSGQTKILHPANGHDDLSNVTALAACEGLGLNPSKKRKYVTFGTPGHWISTNPSVKRQEDQHTLMLELIARTKEQAERRAELEWEIAQASQRTPVWHVGGFDT